MPIEIKIFRKGLALVQGLYYLSLFYRFNDFFGSNQWISPKLWNHSDLLFGGIDGLWIRYVFITVIFYLLYLLYIGKLSRIGLFFLYLLNMSFYLWNPLIIHEPQPLTNLFFISFFLLPLKDNDLYDSWLKDALIVFLGIYYLLSGVKKLPDINFLKGVALEQILSWPVMAKSIDLNLLMVKYLKYPIRVFNYLTLIFEIGFIFFIFTSFRIYLILFGILLHLLIYMTLEVGNFSWVMLLWYALLLDQKTIDSVAKNFKFLKKQREIL